MLFPIFLLVIMFLVHLGFYQYDRCIVEQSQRYAMVRGRELSHASEEEYSKHLNDLFDEILEKQYLILEQYEVAEQFEANTIERWRPVNFIRLCNRMKGD